MKTAIILSEEEAMALPLKKRPLNKRLDSDNYHKVWEHVGRASMCWSPRPSSEVFDTEAASNVALDLCFQMAEAVETAKFVALRDAANLLEDLAKRSDAGPIELIRALREESSKYL